MDPYYRETLRRRFGSFPDILVDELTLPDDSAPNRFRRYDLDTVVGLNVIEHIKEALIVDALAPRFNGHRRQVTWSMLSQGLKASEKSNGAPLQSLTAHRYPQAESSL